jgi:calcium-binding protein CML
MRDALHNARQAFETYATSADKTLSRESLVKAIQSIHEGASAHIIEKIFEFSDVNTSRAIDFKEFIAALTLAMTVNELPSENVSSTETHEQYKELREMLNLIVSAYLIFDLQCNGYIEKSQVTELLNGNSSKSSKYTGFLSQDRWNEMVNIFTFLFFQ